MSASKEGFLVLADISGFTAFVTATAIEHGPPIIAALLEEVIGRVTPPLELIDVEGDAIFALGARGSLVPPAALLEVLREGFAGFRERQRELASDESCTCEACCNVGRLRLKIIGHYGPFLEQAVGGRTQVAGRDVVLAHRLLKNSVSRSADYALLTRDALESMGVDPRRAGFVPHTERYEHFGVVDCFVQDVAAAPDTAGASAPAAAPAAVAYARGNAPS
jgi:hypothetical protein